MNDKEEKGLFKGLRDAVVKWGVITVGGGIIVAVGLFYTIPIAVSQNTTDIKELSEELSIDMSTQTNEIKKVRDDVSNLKMIPAVNQAQIQSIKKNIETIENNIEKIEGKMDKMYDLLIKIDRKD